VEFPRRTVLPPQLPYFCLPTISVIPISLFLSPKISVIGLMRLFSLRPKRKRQKVNFDPPNLLIFVPKDFCDAFCILNAPGGAKSLPDPLAAMRRPTSKGMGRE